MKHMAPNEENIDARYRTMLILWLAQMMSVGMFLLLTQLVDTSGERPANSLLSFTYAGLGTFSAIVSFVVRSKLLQISVEKQDPLMVQKALVVGCALCEVPALLGVLSRFTLPGRDYFLLLLISALSMALHFPRKIHLLAASYKDPSFGGSL